MAEKYELAYIDYKAGMKQKEIAAKYDVSINTVKSWQQRKWKEMDAAGAHEKVRTPGMHTEPEKVRVPSEDISWMEIETEYVTDVRKKPCTLKDLAEKYGISLQGVKQYAAQNNWTEKRNKFYTNAIQKTAEKTADLISGDAAVATARHLSVSTKLLDILEEAVNTPGEFNKVVEKLRVGEFGEEEVQVVQIDALAEKRLATVVSSLAGIQKMQRETLDVANIKEQLAQEQARLNAKKSKLDIEIKNKELEILGDNKDKTLNINLVRKG